MPDRIVRGINGPRGTVLLASALLCFLHGVAYTPLSNGPTDLPIGLEALGSLLPLYVYGLLWLAAGGVALAGAFRGRRGRQRDHADSWGYGTVVGMFIAWGLAYLSGFAIGVADGHPNRSWISAGLYLTAAVIVSAASRMTNPTHGRAGRQ